MPIININVSIQGTYGRWDGNQVANIQDMYVTGKEINPENIIFFTKLSIFILKSVMTHLFNFCILLFKSLLDDEFYMTIIFFISIDIN